MHRWLAGVLFLLAGISGAQAHELLERIDACVARLDQDLDVGYERVVARCPELPADLAHSAWAPWLPADWNQPRNQLSAQGLTELRTLLSRSLTPSASARAPRAQTAPAVLARISQVDDSRQGWWGRFKAWLRKIMAGRERDSEVLGGWLAALNFPHGMAQLISWLALALVVAVALAILVNELRIAGVLKVRGAAPHGSPPGGAQRIAGALSDLERRAAREQPALLLQLIAERLTEQGRLPPARALTARELLQDARLADDSERAALGELASVSEQLRFSTRDFAAAPLAAAIATGRAMLARLATTEPAAAAAAPRA